MKSKYLCPLCGNKMEFIEAIRQHNCTNIECDCFSKAIPNAIMVMLAIWKKIIDITPIGGNVIRAWEQMLSGEIVYNVFDDTGAKFCIINGRLHYAEMSELPIYFDADETSEPDVDRFLRYYNTIGWEVVPKQEASC